MALKIATIKNLPLQLGSFFNDLKSNIASSSSSSSGSSRSNSLSAGYRQLFLQIIAFILFAALSFWVINQVRPTMKLMLLLLTSIMKSVTKPLPMLQKVKLNSRRVQNIGVKI